MTLHITPEEIIIRNKAKQKQWRLDHPERVLEFHKKYNAKPDVTARKTEWARAHENEINMRRRATYYQKHHGALEVISEEVAPEPIV